MSSQADTIEKGFKSKNSQGTCDANGLRGFPVGLTWKNFGNAREEPNFRFRPQFEANQAWTYDAKSGHFDDGAFANSSFYLQGSTYNVKAVTVTNSETHYKGIGELQIWGINQYENYAVICIPMTSNTTSNQGLTLQKMFDRTDYVRLADVFPQGDRINIYYYTSCNPYVSVDSKYKPQTYGSINITTVFFSMPVSIGEEHYTKYVENSVKPCGIPSKIVNTSWIFNEFTGVDIHRAVKMTKRFDISDEMKAKAVFKKMGFEIPAKNGVADYKVVEVNPSKMKDPQTFIADLESGGDLSDAMKNAQQVEIPEIPDDGGIKPRNIAKLIGRIIGVALAIFVLMAIWYYGKKLFITNFNATQSAPTVSTEKLEEFASIVQKNIKKTPSMPGPKANVKPL